MYIGSSRAIGRIRFDVKWIRGFRIERNPGLLRCVGRSAAGPQVRQPNLWDSTQVVGIGHFQLGNDLTSLGIITAVAYGEAHWMGSMVGQWVAPPGITGADFSAAIAEHIQWSLTPGTSVHLYVFVTRDRVVRWRHEFADSWRATDCRVHRGGSGCDAHGGRPTLAYSAIELL